MHMIHMNIIYNTMIATQQLNLLRAPTHLQGRQISGMKLKTMIAGKEQNCYHVLVKLPNRGLKNTEMPGM